MYEQIPSSCLKNINRRKKLVLVRQIPTLARRFLSADTISTVDALRLCCVDIVARVKLDTRRGNMHKIDVISCLFLLEKCLRPLQLRLYSSLQRKRKEVEER